jgi:RimJ/RimL family protein N-acetyltransferase
MKLRTHDVTLVGSRITLRPLTEHDWDILLPWNKDPEVLLRTEGEDVCGYDLAQVQEIYRTVSQSAHCFIAIFRNSPIGECWLQEMKLERIARKYPDRSCRRIDLMIGEKSLWGHGLGTEMIRLLTTFAFDHEHADMVFACGVADDNVASLKAFQKAGFTIAARIEQPAPGNTRYCWDLCIGKGQDIPTVARQQSSW